MNGLPIARAAHHSLIRLSAAGLTALTLGLASPATAADFAMRYKTPPPPVLPVYSWTGLYLGGQVGYAVGKDDLYEYVTTTNVFTNFEKHYNMQGVTGGIYGGGNYQIGTFVVGLEADFEGSNITGSWSDALAAGAGDTKINWQSSVRGRLGFVADNALFYGTGGVAFGNVSHTYGNLLNGISETTSSVRTGWTAGAGIEVALTPNLLARVEYRYTDYGLSSYDSITSFPGLTGTQNAKLNTIRVGAAYKF